MRLAHWFLLVLAIVATAVAVRAFDARHSSAAQASVLTPVGTVKEIMEGIIDPSSDVLFDAVAVDISSKGIVETKPTTDEDWANVQRNALMLVRGRPSDQVPRQGAELAGVARVLGRPAGSEPGEFLDDYLRTARRARAAAERVFLG